MGNKLLVWYKTHLQQSFLRSTSKINGTKGRWLPLYHSILKPRNKNLRIKVKIEIQLQRYWHIILNESCVDCFNLSLRITRDQPFLKLVENIKTSLNFTIYVMFEMSEGPIYS